VAICHEGWRYPETVRWAVRHGAHIVFHPHFHEAEPGGYRPSSFADPANSFHEKAVLCRAAENTCILRNCNPRAGRRPLRRWCGLTGHCSATSHTAKKGCSSRTSISLRPQASSRHAANLPRHGVGMQCINDWQTDCRKNPKGATNENPDKRQGRDVSPRSGHAAGTSLRSSSRYDHTGRLCASFPSAARFSGSSDCCSAFCSDNWHLGILRKRMDAR
jgi:hypothetical protein